MSHHQYLSTLLPSWMTGCRDRVSAAMLGIVRIGQGRRGRLRQIALYAIMLVAVIRISLPWVLLAVINHNLTQPGVIHGHVDGLSLGILRGVSDIDHIHLTSLNPETGNQDRLLDIDALETAIDWTPLIAGRLEGSLDLKGVALHLGAPAQEIAKDKARPWTDQDWRTTIRDMVRVRISSITISGAQFVYDDAVRHVHATCSTIDGRIEHLIVPVGSDRPARFTFTGVTPGDGMLQIAGTAQAQTDKPHLSMQASLEQVDLPALSPITEHYDGLIFRSGRFSGYLDVQLDGTHLNGTFKPIFHHLDVTTLRTASGSAATALFWSVVVPVATYVLKNGDKDQHAAIIPIDGIIDEPHTDPWMIAVSALRNAFVAALVPGFDGLTAGKSGT